MRLPEAPWREVQFGIGPEQEGEKGLCWSEATRSLERTIRQIAPTNLPVLVVGECGTGKAFRARQIHRLSARCSAPLKQVISSSAHPEWIASELGSNGETGTLYLKEVSELSSAAQRSLLYSMPDGDAADCDLKSPRLICSTSADLESEVKAGRFRRDLYYRLKAVCIHLAPLREVKADIPALAEILLGKHASAQNRPRPQLEPEDLAILQNWSWPGNIRELENVIRQMVVLNDVKGVLRELARPAQGEAGSTGREEEHSGIALKAAARAASREREEQLILEALAKTRWNRKKAAQKLQISYKSLLSKLKQMGDGKTG